jgi:NCS1 family nucleobase:cation symporter-1
VKDEKGKESTVADEHKSRAIEALDKLYEFEREPVSEDKLQPGRHFAGVFAGEHVAGTEFVIGALFVAWGVTAYDIFVGLLIGNALAVLTWTFVCAPIAVQTRLTLYWYLRRIAGPVTTTVYNILNALLFCVLAGCMITVSASAVRIPFGIPAQTMWYPQDVRFVIIVILVGALVVTLAVLGFKRLAQFSEVCSPWMFLMFIAGAVVMLPVLANKALGHPLNNLADFWQLANTSIWIGKTPDGRPPMSFWHVTAFAWICNLAMHGGLSDMAIFRYAKKPSYGLYSAFGMYLGHYLAWICAGVMGAATALALGTTIDKLDAGAVAWQALGVTGIITVILAGWTTSNPTLYRAGLAFQAVTPNWPRWLVTLVAGIATTIVACFPFVFTRLLDFVGVYGLLLMPVGAIVFVEHWIFPRIGLTQFWVSRKKLMVNWPALLSWGIGMAVALVLERTGTLHLFFLFVPVWVLTAVLYTIFAAMAGARDKLPALAEERAATTRAVGSSVKPSRVGGALPPGRRAAMLWTSGIVALAALAACLILPIYVYSAAGGNYEQSFATFKSIIIWPTLIYFIAGTIWLACKEG